MGPDPEDYDGEGDDAFFLVVDGGHPDDEPGPYLRPPESHDPRDFNPNLKRCQHGLLLTQGCAICDPEGWKLLGGAE